MAEQHDTVALFLRDIEIVLEGSMVGDCIDCVADVDRDVSREADALRLRLPSKELLREVVHDREALGKDERVREPDSVTEEDLLSDGSVVMLRGERVMLADGVVVFGGVIVAVTLRVNESEREALSLWPTDDVLVLEEEHSAVLEAVSDA